LLWAFLLVQLIWPGSAFEASCQLTFAALLGLSTAARLAPPRFSPRKPWLYALAEKAVKALILSIGAWLATAPIVLFWFQHFVPLAPFYGTLALLPFCGLFIVAGGPVLLLYYLAFPGSSSMLEIVLCGGAHFVERLEMLRATVSGTFFEPLTLAPEQGANAALLALGLAFFLAAGFRRR
jgi:hypothetical protein